MEGLSFDAVKIYKKNTLISMLSHIVCLRSLRLHALLQCTTTIRIFSLNKTSRYETYINTYHEGFNTYSLWLTYFP